MALIAFILAASISSNPSRLVLGKDAGATIEVHAPPGAKVTLSTSVGTVGEPERDGGVFRAKYTPPTLKSPSVALVLAQIDDGEERQLKWLSIPLSGSDTMVIETRPGSKVQADVAGTMNGPVTADANGNARLPMVVPPGVEKATLHITDKLGNTTRKPLDLEPPPFSRVRMAPREDAASTSEPLEVEIFVVKPDGTPDDHAKVSLASKDGETEMTGRAGPGVYLAEFTPPRGKTGSAHLEAKANGQLTALDVPVGVGRPHRLWRSALRSQQEWSLSGGLIGGAGGTFDGAGAGTLMAELAVRLETLPMEAVLDGGLGFYSELNQPGAAPGTTESARPKTQYVQAGIRLGRELVQGLDGHATVAIGAQHQSVERTLPTGAVVSQSAWTPRFAFAFGANLRLGPGRALAELQLDATGSDVAGLTTGLGSAQVLVGYLVTIR